MPTLDDIMRGEDAVARNTVMVLDAFYDWMDTPPKRDTTMPKLDMENITDDDTEALLSVARRAVEQWKLTDWDREGALAQAMRDLDQMLNDGHGEEDDDDPDYDENGNLRAGVDHATDGVPATTRSYATTNQRIDEALAVVDELIEWADADAQHASENDARDTARDDMRRGTQLRNARKLMDDSRR